MLLFKVYALPLSLSNTRDVKIGNVSIKPKHKPEYSLNI